MALTIPQIKRLLDEHMCPSFDRNTVEGLLDEIARLSKPNVGEQLRLWVWAQIEKHGDDLVASKPVFDLVLNKIDEFAALEPQEAEPVAWAQMINGTVVEVTDDREKMQSWINAGYPDIRQLGFAAPVPASEKAAGLQELHQTERAKLGEMLRDKSPDGQAAANWQGGKVNGIAAAIEALGSHPGHGWQPEGCLDVGGQVLKTKGYAFPGEVRAVFKTKAGFVRYVVEATGAEYAGMLHIFSPDQISSGERGK